MKNNKHDLIGLFTRLKAHDGAYGNSRFSVPVLAGAFGFAPEDFEQGKHCQVDHFIPQNAHLDPENFFDADIIEALGLTPDSLKEVNGHEVYVVSGTAIIDALFDKFLPELPRDKRPSQDNIVNLRPMTSVANNRKSNRLSGTMQMMFETLCGHAQGYDKHIYGEGNDADVPNLCAAFGNRAPEITKVLQAIDAVDTARRDSSVRNTDYMAIPRIDLGLLFQQAAQLSEDRQSEANFMLQTHTAFFKKEMLMRNFPVADRLSNRGLSLTPGFTGSVVDLGGNFRESYDRFRVHFLAYAKARLPDIIEERNAERQVGYVPRAA